MPANEQKYKALMATARNTNLDRDRIDRELGFTALSDTSVGDLIATAMTAIEAGIKVSDWSCVAEGLAMLQDDPRVEQMRTRA